MSMYFTDQDLLDGHSQKMFKLCVFLCMWSKPGEYSFHVMRAQLTMCTSILATKHTPAALCNSGGVPTVAATQRLQGVLLPAGKLQWTIYDTSITAIEFCPYFSFFNSCANLPTLKRSQAIRITFWHVCTNVCVSERERTAENCILWAQSVKKDWHKKDQSIHVS